jgi:hypothetical protein
VIHEGQGVGGKGVEIQTPVGIGVEDLGILKF